MQSAWNMSVDSIVSSSNGELAVPSAHNTDVAPTSERVAEGLVLLSICTVAICTNLFLWIAVLRTPELRSPSSCLLLCLSFADLLVSAVNMPVSVYTIFLGRWAFSDRFCQATGFSNMVAFVASVGGLSLITVNRYIRVCRPTTYDTIYSPRGLALNIAGLWLLSVGLSLPPLFGWGDYAYVPTQYFCFCNWKSSLAYAIFMIVISFCGTSSLMTSCYVAIYRTFARSNRAVSASGRPGQSRDSDVSSGKWEVLSGYVAGYRSIFSPWALYAKRSQGSSASLGKFSPPSQCRHNATFADQGSVKLTRFSGADDPGARLPVNKTCPHLPSLSTASPRQATTLGGTTGDQRTSADWFDEDGDFGRVNFAAPGPSEDSGDPSMSVLASQDRTSKGRSDFLRFTRSCSASELSAMRRVDTSTSLASSARGDRRRREEMRVTVTILLVIFVYVISWLPYCVTILLNVLLTRPLPRHVDMFVILLGYTNSLCNPLIYGLRNSHIRSAYKKLLGDIRVGCYPRSCLKRKEQEVEFYL